MRINDTANFLSTAIRPIPIGSTQVRTRFRNCRPEPNTSLISLIAFAAAGEFGYRCVAILGLYSNGSSSGLEERRVRVFEVGIESWP
jgi:hypothetical protein